jgi:hypothetical protein
MIKKTKKEMEEIIFKTFISVEPNFAGGELKCEQCPKDPPDFICIEKKRRIGVELGEWLHENQTARSRAFYDIERKIKGELPDTIKDFLRSHDISIRPVQGIFPSKSYRSRFILELFDYLNKFVLSEPMTEEEDKWDDFNQHPILQKYITKICVSETTSPSDILFIKGGPCSPEDPLNALFDQLNAKINHRKYKNLKKKWD